MHLPDGGLFKPDLVLIDEQGGLLFVEVERDMDKNIEKCQAKRCNFYQASDVRLFVVCNNSPCIRNLHSKINYCLGNQLLTISLTNLSDIQSGKRCTEDSIWLETKHE